MNVRLMLITAVLLPACAPGEGAWELETWGEDYIERGIPADEFADGCSATFDRFSVALVQRALVHGDGTVVAELGGEAVVDVALPGPHPVGAAPVPSTHYDRVDVRVAPVDGASVVASGTVTCDATTVRFDWSFDTDTTYICEPEDLTVPVGGADRSQFTVHGDHFFYDALEAPDAALQGWPIVHADANGDGEVTRAELAGVPVAPLGYAVGSRSEVTDLDGFVEALTQTLGHIDGEGHCTVVR